MNYQLIGDSKLPMEEVKALWKQTNKACGAPYQPGMIVYTCQDCQVDEYCSICADCFRHGNHEGHQWRAVKIDDQEGCCDCGNPDAWATEGNCKHHKGLESMEMDMEEEKNDEGMYIFTEGAFPMDSSWDIKGNFDSMNISINALFNQINIEWVYD